MSAVSFQNLVCVCGHSGTIKLKENDTPYSVGNWESYSLSDFEGKPYKTTISQSWEIVLEYMKPICPKCGTMLNSKNLVK